jgi:hypothetical protein
MKLGESIDRPSCMRQGTSRGVVNEVNQLIDHQTCGEVWGRRCEGSKLGDHQSCDEIWGKVMWGESVVWTSDMWWDMRESDVTGVSWLNVRHVMRYEGRWCEGSQLFERQTCGEVWGKVMWRESVDWTSDMRRGMRTGDVRGVSCLNVSHVTRYEGRWCEGSQLFERQTCDEVWGKVMWGKSVVWTSDMWWDMREVMWGQSVYPHVLENFPPYMLICILVPR